MVNIPPSRQKQYHEFPLVMCVTESAWLHEICESALTETRKDRGVLIICETIQQANQIGERLRTIYRSSAIKLYTMNNANQERQVDLILPGEIIIATNLAGRGTDIKTSEIESTGGLHVVLTYMPANQRVEDQAFGRTARQGKRGTGQMILNMSSVIMTFGSDNNVVQFDSHMVKAKRDDIESIQLKNFKENELKQIELKDDMFKEFATFINSTVRASIRKTRTLTWGETIFGESAIIMPSVYEQNMLSAIEEQWAMFLHKFEHNVIKAANAKEECRKLIEKLKKVFI